MNYKLKHSLPHEPMTCLGWLLDARGVEDIEEYVSPTSGSELDPYLLDNIEEAARCVKKHLDEDNEIVMVVDCDCDGYTASAMLYNYIRDFYPKAKIKYFFHEHKQHGLEDLFTVCDEGPWKLVLIADAASNDYEYHKKLKESGKDVVVLDHHEAPQYSEDAIVVNNQLSPRYPNKSFCGAGIVYKFLMVMDELLDAKNHCRKYLDLCALGNIADCMSMTSPETRFYIVKGLQKVENRGFAALVAQQEFSLFRTTRYLTYVKVAFYISPLINAVIRVGTMEEKKLLFEMFVNPDRLILTNKTGALPGTMAPLATEMARRAYNIKNRQNRIKEKATQLLENRVQKEGLLDNKVLIVKTKESDGIPQELRGVICSQFVAKYHRPCAIVAKNEEGYLRGSIRGNAAFEEVPDFKEFLENSGCVEFVQGHANAAGLSIHESQLSNLLKYANSNISDKGLENCYYVDYIFQPDENLQEYSRLFAYNDLLWGNDIEEPTIVIENIPFTGIQWALMGANQDSAKLVYNGMEIVRFKDPDFAWECKDCRRGVITVYGKLSINTYKGKTTTQFTIDDYDIKNTSSEF